MKRVLPLLLVVLSLFGSKLRPENPEGVLDVPTESMRGKVLDSTRPIGQTDPGRFSNIHGGGGATGDKKINPKQFLDKRHFCRGNQLSLC